MLMMLPFTVMAAFSCTELNPSMEMESNLSKITNTPENVCQESILIQVTKGTGIESLQGIEGIASVERIFPDVAGTEEKAAEFGLDRWYKAFVAKGSDIETAARNAATAAQNTANTAQGRQTPIGPFVSVAQLIVMRANHGSCFDINIQSLFNHLNSFVR